MNYSATIPTHIMDEMETLFQSIPLDNPFHNVPRGTILQNLEYFATTLCKWNQSINLISKSTEQDIWKRHILDSVQLLPYIQKDVTLLDIGTGGGFPGMVLAICGISDVHMVESDARKSAFLHEIASIVLRGTIHCTRMESMQPFAVHTITSRACASLSTLFSLVEPFIEQTQHMLFLKGKNIQDEIAEAHNKWDFSYQLHPSITSEEGYILEIDSIAAKGGNDDR